MADYWDTLQQTPVQEDPGLWNGLFPQGTAFGPAGLNNFSNAGKYADFHRTSNIEDRRLENHHRPMDWHPGPPRDEVRWTPMGHELGLTGIENQITNNDAQLASSQLAEQLGALDLYKLLRFRTP